jgi:hypothetical protein
MEGGHRAEAAELVPSLTCPGRIKRKRPQFLESAQFRVHHSKAASLAASTQASVGAAPRRRGPAAGPSMHSSRSLSDGRA